MQNPELTIGEATKLVQGYPTQVWLPRHKKHTNAGYTMFLHDRRLQDEQPGIFVLQGNHVSEMTKPGPEVCVVNDEKGGRRFLRIPSALLWKNHGGPCTRRGEEYPQIPEEIMDEVYRDVELGKLSVLSALTLRGSESYMGPFDYSLPVGSERLRFEPMRSELLMPSR